MQDFKGKVVESLAGNDKGHLFVVLKNVGTEYVLYADGRKRKTDNPKTKKVMHLKVVGESEIDVDAATNGVLRKETARFARASAEECSDNHDRGE